MAVETSATEGGSVEIRPGLGHHVIAVEIDPVQWNEPKPLGEAAMEAIFNPDFDPKRVRDPALSE